jgi:hypothetical protein
MRLIIFLTTTLLLNTALFSAPLVDPTMPASYNKHNSDKQGLESASTNNLNWKLNSTLIVPNRRSLAIINGIQLHVGEEINGAIVIAIAHQYVRLRHQDTIVTLNLHKSFISDINNNTQSINKN